MSDTTAIDVLMDAFNPPAMWEAESAVRSLRAHGWHPIEDCPTALLLGAANTRAQTAEAELASVREERDAAREQLWATAALLVELQEEHDTDRAVAAEARVAQLEAGLDHCVRVLDAVLPYVTGYDAVPYQDAVIAARALLASQPLPTEPEDHR